MKMKMKMNTAVILSSLFLVSVSFAQSVADSKTAKFEYSPPAQTQEQPTEVARLSGAAGQGVTEHIAQTPSMMADLRTISIKPLTFSDNAKVGISDFSCANLASLLTQLNTDSAFFSFQANCQRISKIKRGRMFADILGNTAVIIGTFGAAAIVGVPVDSEGQHRRTIEVLSPSLNVASSSNKMISLNPIRFESSSDCQDSQTALMKNLKLDADARLISMCRPDNWLVTSIYTK